MRLAVCIGSVHILEWAGKFSFCQCMLGTKSIFSHLTNSIDWADVFVNAMADVSDDTETAGSLRGVENRVIPY